MMLRLRSSLLSRLCLLVFILAAAPSARAAKVIDVMFVYTPAAASYNGGTSGMNALINASVTATNIAFTNSGIEARVRVVHRAQISYTETGSLQTDLTRLRTAGDGFMDQVHAWRTTYGADFVCLIRRGAAGGAAGIGYLMTSVNNSFASSAFTVVADNYAVSRYTFAHELGHNLGCHHDRANAGGGTGAYSYSFGYNFTGNNAVNYGTVMCYPGQRIPYFSNPSVSYQGVATGVAAGGTSANNALSINNTRTTAAALKTAADTIVAGECSGDDKSDLLFSGLDGQVRIWAMNDTSRSSSTLLPSTFTSSFWTLFGCADLDGDSDGDLVFKGNDGRIWVWIMDGTTKLSATILNYTFTTAFWSLAAIGDLNNDGRADLVFKGNDGRVWVWFMNGTTRLSSQILPYTFTGGFWSLVCAADLDDNGTPDLIFRGSDGRIWIWLMNGTTSMSKTVLGYDYNASAWSLAAAGDLSGDGKADLIFKGVAGQLWIWRMNGTTRLSTGVLSHSMADE